MMNRVMHLTAHIINSEGKHYSFCLSDKGIRKTKKEQANESLLMTQLQTKKEELKTLKKNMKANQLRIDEINQVISELDRQIKDMYKKFTGQLDSNKIDYVESETNFLLVDSPRTYKETKTDLKAKDITLYESNDQIGTYWTLPFSTTKVNNKIIEVLNYD